MLALSYEPVPLAAMVEGRVTARLVRLMRAGAPAIAALLLWTKSVAAPASASAPRTPPESIAEALRSPLITACGLLTNILSSAGHLAWPEVGSRERAAAAAATGSRRRSSVSGPPPPPTFPVLAHPAVGECLSSLAEIAGLAGAARRAGGGARWRLLAAHSTLVVFIVARAAAPGNGLAPELELTKREMRWRDVDSGVRAHGVQSGGAGAGAGGTVWGAMASAVDEALGSLSPEPGRRLVGGRGEEEEASYEEGSIWQWCLECARSIEAAPGGASENTYVSSGVLPYRVLKSLAEAASDGRI